MDLLLSYILQHWGRGTKSEDYHKQRDEENPMLFVPRRQVAQFFKEAAVLSSTTVRACIF